MSMTEFHRTDPVHSDQLVQAFLIVSEGQASDDRDEPARLTYADHPMALRLRAMNIVYETTKEREPRFPMRGMIDSLGPAVVTPVSRGGLGANGPSHIDCGSRIEDDGAGDRAGGRLGQHRLRQGAGVGDAGQYRREVVGEALVALDLQSGPLDVANQIEAGVPRAGDVSILHQVHANHGRAVLGRANGGAVRIRPAPLAGE
jgi:hypothetical protein